MQPPTIDFSKLNKYWWNNDVPLDEKAIKQVQCGSKRQIYIITLLTFM